MKIVNSSYTRENCVNAMGDFAYRRRDLTDEWHLTSRIYPEFENGKDRPDADSSNLWRASRLWVEYSLEPAKISSLRFPFDSDLNRKSLNMPCNYPLEPELKVPSTMVRAFASRLDDQGNGGRFSGH